MQTITKLELHLVNFTYLMDFRKKKLPKQKKKD